MGHGYLLDEEGLRRARRRHRQTHRAGWLRWRLEATGRGLLFITRETLKRIGRELSGSTIAIQGFGNVGSNAARLLHAAGANVVAVSDVCGRHLRPARAGPAAPAWRTTARRVNCAASLVRSCSTTPALLRLDADVLLPAAMEGQITHANAAEIRARVIVEGANGPTTADADEILARRGVLVVPDILANAGG